MIFGEILKELRQEKRLSHEQLAKALGVSRAIIGFWESGKREPTGSSVAAVAQYFDVTADYLLGLECDDGTKISL